MGGWKEGGQVGIPGLGMFKIVKEKRKRERESIRIRLIEVSYKSKQQKAFFRVEM